MARPKLLEETEKEIAAKACGEIGTMVRDLTDVSYGEAPAVGSEDEGAVSRGGGLVGSANDDASGDECLCMYWFNASTITLGRIREMAEKGYFVEGEA
jgi:hypothetical protein